MSRQVFATLLEQARDAALEILSPTRCAGCERPGALVCERCLHELRLIDPSLSCTRCGAPFGSLVCTECAPLQEGATPPIVRGPERVLAMAEFTEPLARTIRAYKDAGERRLAPLFAEMLLDTAEHAEAVAPERYGGILSDADAVSFVPATASAFRRRGFDHMELPARHLCELAGKPLLDALAKHGASDQRALGREGRRREALGAYEVVADVEGMRVLLIDDVVTTGATIAAAADALIDAGALHVDALSLARVAGGS